MNPPVPPCSNCGNPELRPGAKFCPRCGARQAIQSTSQGASPALRCPNCGNTDLRPGTKFCGECGFRLPEAPPGPAPDKSGAAPPTDLSIEQSIESNRGSVAGAEIGYIGASEKSEKPTTSWLTSHRPLTSRRYSSFIAARIAGFTGREWVLNEIEAWLGQPAGSRCYILTGEPGSGKSVVAGQLAAYAQGSTPVPPGLKQIKPGFLGAGHFCIARQADTIDPLNFTQAISHQLTQIDGFALHLLRKAGIELNIQQNISQNYGTVIGAQIKTLVIKAPSASVAFTHTVLEPLKALYASRQVLFNEPMVILVDALDEASQHQGETTIVDLLANAGDLPPQVRFLLTTRPEPEVLRHFEGSPRLSLSERAAENLADLRQYIERRLEGSKPVQVRLGQAELPGGLPGLVDRLLAASQGNFLYIERMLPDLEAGSVPLDDLSGLPHGLDGVYREHLRTRRVGRSVDHWRANRPLFGALVAAQSPLTDSQLAQAAGVDIQACNDFLIDATEFLDVVEDETSRYQLYHQTLVDFLTDRSRAAEFWIDPITAHQGMIAGYRARAASWDAMKWCDIDEYGLSYLSYHHYALRQDERARRSFFELICRSYWEEKQHRFDSPLPFVRDLELGIEIARGETPPNLPELLRLSLIYATLRLFSTSLPPEALEALARVGDLRAALDHVRLIQQPERLARAYRLLAEVVAESGDKQRAGYLLDEALSAAYRIADPANRSQALSSLAGVMVKVDRQAQLLQVAAGLDEKWKAHCLAALAENLALTGDLTQGLALLGQIIDPEARAILITAICRAAALASQKVKLQIRPEQLEQLIAQVRGLPQVAGSAQAYSALAVITPTSQAGELVSGAMDALVRIPDEYSRLDAFKTALPSLRGAGQLEQAYIPLQSFLDLRLDAHAAYLSELARAGMVNQAVSLVAVIPDNDVRAVLQSHLAYSFASAGNKQKALDLIKPILAANETFNAERLRARIMSYAARTLARCGEFEEAAQVADQIPRGSNDLMSRFRWYLKRSNTGEGPSMWLREMQGIYNRLYQAYAQSQALAELADCLALAARPIQAQDTVSAMPSNRRRVETLSQLAVDTQIIGNSPQAYQFANLAVSESYALPFEAARYTAVESISKAIARLQSSGNRMDKEGFERLLQQAQSSWEGWRNKPEAVNVKTVLGEDQGWELDQVYELSEYQRLGVRRKSMLAFYGYSALYLFTTAASLAAIFYGDLSSVGDLIRSLAALPGVFEIAQTLWKIDAYTELAGLMGAAETSEQGQARAELMAEIAEVLIKKDDKNRARQARLMTAIHHLGQPRIETLVLALAGEFVLAHQVAQDILPLEARAAALADIARGISLGGDKARASQVIDEARALLLPLPDSFSKQVARQSLGKAMAAQTKRAVFTIHAGQAWEATKNVRQGLMSFGRQAFQALGVSDAKTPFAPGAVQPFGNEASKASLPPVNLEGWPPALSEEYVIESCLQAQALLVMGDAETALATAVFCLEKINYLSKPAVRAEVLAALAQVFTRQDDRVRAVQAVQLAHASLGSAQDEKTSLVVLAEVLPVMSRYGQKEEALALAEKAYEQVIARSAQYELSDDEAATILAGFGRAFNLIGRPWLAHQAFAQAIDSARFAGREAIFETVIQGTPILGTIQDVPILNGLGEAISRVDSWWR